jgi:integrase
MYETFVKPTFGKKYIKAVKRSDVKRFYNRLKEDRGLKVSTIDNVHNVLYQVFQFAVNDDMIRTNPTAKMMKELKISYGNDAEKKKALTVEQQQLFLSFLKQHPQYNHWYPVFYIMLYTGMRVGEITGLRWNDINLETGEIDVNHTLVYYNHRDEKGCYFSVNTPKTEAGRRIIPMSDGVKEAFQMEKDYQEKTGVKCVGNVDGYHDFIFVNRYGNVQHQGTLNKAIRRIVRDCNDEVLNKRDIDTNPVLLPHFSCHITRHTYATRLCEAGINIKVIQDILGHSDIDTTMNIYVDVTTALKKKEIADFDTYMDNIKESDPA